MKRPACSPHPRAETAAAFTPPDATHRLTLIHFAKETGFSLPEIKLLLHGFPSTVTAGDRWRKLATSKIQQLEATSPKHALWSRCSAP